MFFDRSETGIKLTLDAVKALVDALVHAAEQLPYISERYFGLCHNAPASVALIRNVRSASPIQLQNDHFAD
jgi:hypothetical protein